MIKNNENQEKYCISSANVVEKFGIALPTLAKWRQHKKNLDFLKIGKSVRYCEKDVINFLESKRIKAEV